MNYTMNSLQTYAYRAKTIIILTVIIIHLFMKSKKDYASEDKYILAVDDDSDIVTLIQQNYVNMDSKCLLLLIRKWL